MTTINDYISTITSLQKAEYKRIRAIVRQVIPGVEETVSYGVPAFKYKGRPVIYFGAFKNHMSIFPASDLMIETLGEAVGKFRTSKGTLQFTSDNPISDSLIKKIVCYRLADISKK